MLPLQRSIVMIVLAALAALAAVGLAVGAAPVVAADAEPCRLSVRWEQQPPYGVRMPDGRRSGYYAEAVREAARRIGCEVDFIEMPWARGLHELETGRLDVMAGVLKTPERERIARFTRPINLSPNLLLVEQAAARAWPLRKLDALADTPLRVGVESGAFYGPDYQRLLAEPRFVTHLHTVIDRPRGWRMLREGRLDGIIADQGSALVEGLGLPTGRRLVPVLVISAMPAHVMVGRHRDASLVTRLDAAFDAMVAEGWLPQLREAWIPCAADPVTLGCRTGERIGVALPPPRAAGAREAAELSPPSP